MFKRAVVIDVITHPNSLTDQLINSLTTDQSEYALNLKKIKIF